MLAGTHQLWSKVYLKAHHSNPMIQPLTAYSWEQSRKRNKEATSLLNAFLYFCSSFNRAGADTREIRYEIQFLSCIFLGGFSHWHTSRCLGSWPQTLSLQQIRLSVENQTGSAERCTFGLLGECPHPGHQCDWGKGWQLHFILFKPIHLLK